MYLFCVERKPKFGCIVLTNEKKKTLYKVIQISSQPISHEMANETKKFSVVPTRLEKKLTFRLFPNVCESVEQLAFNCKKWCEMVPLGFLDSICVWLNCRGKLCVFENKKEVLLRPFCLILFLPHLPSRVIYGYEAGDIQNARLHWSKRFCIQLGIFLRSRFHLSILEFTVENWIGFRAYRRVWDCEN